MMVLISDFMAPGGWQQPLSSLAIRHEVIAVWITDPRESEIPDVGIVTFEDPESGRQILVDTGSTARIVRDILPKAHFATVYAKPAGAPMCHTFVTEVSQDTWIFFPWDLDLQYVEPISDGTRQARDS